jgi:hypothetical protein
MLHAKQESRASALLLEGAAEVLSYERPLTRPALDSELGCKHEIKSGRPAISQRSCQICTSLNEMVAVEENEPCVS